MFWHNFFTAISVLLIGAFLLIGSFAFPKFLARFNFTPTYARVMALFALILFQFLLPRTPVDENPLTGGGELAGKWVLVDGSRTVQEGGESMDIDARTCRECFLEVEGDEISWELHGSITLGGSEEEGGIEAADSREMPATALNLDCSLRAAMRKEGARVDYRMEERRCDSGDPGDLGLAGAFTYEVRENTLHTRSLVQDAELGRLVTELTYRRGDVSL